MTQHNVGALVVVKPGEQQALAGIITERGKIRSDQQGKFFFFVCLLICVIHFRHYDFFRLPTEDHSAREIIQINKSWRHYD